MSKSVPAITSAATVARPSSPTREFIEALNGFSLTTAEILYRLPDYPALLQTFVWQDFDLHPRFPKLTQFLEFWNAKLEGKLYRVSVAHSKLLKPSEIKLIDGQFRLN